jgi:hypothetical protein
MWYRWQWHRGGCCQGRGLQGERQVEARLVLLPGVSCPAPPPQLHTTWASVQETRRACKRLPRRKGPLAHQGPFPRLQEWGWEVHRGAPSHSLSWNKWGLGMGSNAVYKALKPFMVPGGRLTIL